MASQQNHVEVIKILLASGANINLGRKVRILLTVGELGDSDYIAAHYTSLHYNMHIRVYLANSLSFAFVTCDMCPTSFLP